MAKQAKSTTVRVLLLAGRTGVGRRGQVVDYPADEAVLHAIQGTVRILDGDASNETGETTEGGQATGPLESQPIPGFPGQEALAAQVDPVAEDGTDGDPDEPDEPADAYKKKPLRQKRRR